MLKKLTFSIMAILIIASLTFASDTKTEVNAKANLVFDNSTGKVVSNYTPPSKTQVGEAIYIGAMFNAYTTQASFTNQIYYDPYSNLIGIIKRSDPSGPGSGYIYYQVSDDLGQNWTSQIGPMNAEGHTSGRHPNIVLSNPTKGSLENVSVVAGWAELDASWLYYAFSGEPLGSMAPTTTIYEPYYPGDEMFVNSQGHAFGVVALIEYPEDGTNNYLFKSEDGGLTWEQTSISYNTDFYDDTWNGTKGDINSFGNGYIMVQGQNPEWGDEYHFAVKATSDDGSTWAEEWSWVNVFDVAYGEGVLGDVVQALNYEVDFITYTPEGSEEAYAFFAGTFVDTTGSNTGIYVIDNQTGDWRATQISTVNATSMTLPGSGGLTTLNEVEFARSEQGSVLALKYADLPTAEATMYDLFVTWYDGETWTPVENYTQTTDVYEKYSQTASILHEVAENEWQLISMYTIFGDGDTEDTAPSELWYVDGVTAHVEPKITSVEDNEEIAVSFSLSQNYPNPFNPSTTIKYSVPQVSEVSLKVYDVLGREVATLVDAQQAQGTYQVNFDASNLASGMYIYTIKAGSFVSSKKMLLMK